MSEDAIEIALERARQGSTFEAYALPVETDAQRVDRLEMERAPVPEPTRIEVRDAARLLESHTRNIARSMAQAAAQPDDPDYVPPTVDSPEFKAAVEGVPEEYWSRLGNARSEGQFRDIRDNVLNELEAERTLAAAGWSGTGMRIAENIADPIALATMIGSGGGAWVARGSRLARIAKSAALAGGSNAALEGLLSANRETKSPDDMFVALVAGTMFGGAAGLLSRGEQKAMYTLGKELADGAPGPGRVATEVNLHLDNELSVGARENVGIAKALAEDVPDEVFNTPKLGGVEGKLRFDWYADLAKSDNPYVRYGGRFLLEDPVGTKGVAQAASAEEFAQVLKKRALTQFYREANGSLADYLKEVPVGQRAAATDKFFEAVSNAVRMEDFSDPVIGRAARGFAQAIQTTAAEAKRFGVKGFENLELGGGYVPRLPSAAKIAQLVSRFGSAQVDELLANALSRGLDIDPEKARLIAQGYIKNVRMRGAGVTTDFKVALADYEVVADMMRKAGMTEDQISSATQQLKVFGEKDTTKSGKIARAKRRLDLDESVTAKLKANNGEMVDVSVTDLFENDARLLSRMYVSSVGGHTAMARAGITSPAEWEKFINKARLYAADLDPGQAAKADKEVTKMQTVYDKLTGKPLVDYNDPVNALSFLARDWAYLAQSGMFGFAQASELAAVLTSGGLRLTLEAVPEMKAMFTRAVDGKLSDDLARTIEEFVAPGTDAVLHSTVSRFSGEYDELLRPTGSSMFEIIQPKMHTARKIAGYASGLTPLTVGMQRLASRFIAQRVVNEAMGTGARGISEMRLRAMGIDGAMQKRVFGQIKKHSFMQGDIPRLDLESWTDLDARDAFALAVARETDRTVLTPSLGGSWYYQHTGEFGKVVTQFMTFAAQAHSRLLIHGVKHMDAERAVNWLFGTALAGLAYTARTHTESIGRKDREKFLRERLAPDRIAAAAFNMSGFSALLPPVIDTALAIAPGKHDKIFSHSRTSGLGSSMADLTNLPAGAVIAGIGNAASAFHDGKMTQAEWRQVQRAIPMARVVGIRQILDILGSNLPEK